ncbi:TolC family protein [Pasteurellaceae bacterium LIM206]|nr:TolC family protein [Pasteurellaceae bacterium LIM206]
MNRQITFTLSLLAMLSLTACQNTQVSGQSAVSIPAVFSHNGTQQTDLTQWWQAWHDPILTGLIERGLKQNPDYKIALSRLNEANANLDYREADKGVNVAANANAGANRRDVDTAFGIDSEGSATNLYGGLQASWEPDFFGKKQSDSDAAAFTRDAVQQQVYATQMLISADIAEHYLNARAIQQQQKTAARQIATLESLAKYVKGRFAAGHTTAYEVTETDSQISQAKARQATLQAQYAQEVRAIAVLLGEVPQQFNLPDGANILANQPAAPLGPTPQGLLERRPDLKAYAYQVQAAAAKVASAKADLYPRFSINFMGEGGRISIDGDTALKGWLGMASAGITAPIFTNGRIQANINAADARLKTALLDYDKALLNALKDVDTAYHLQQSLARQIQLLRQAKSQSEQQANDAEKLFKYDKKTLDSTINARLNAINVQNNLIQSELSQSKALIGVYKALGGGWKP